ncbi:MAG: O-succinylhomoserine sulfhydrylase [Magnetococcales bacterium]|nr:O-succinylhomoserine sulfhydrylase [Magnetococcales bacterium]MBF0114398.1 O-succinylhomoserine sulfhydrylase [Magnetococcales bacterium]
MNHSEHTLPRKSGLATTALHAGRRMTEERENSPALFLNSSFVFTSAAQAQAIFAGSEEGNLYSRFTNPSVMAFEERIAALEGGEKALATASGMAAITTIFLTFLAAGDHLVMSRSVFGSTTTIANTLLAKLGIKTTQVALSDLDAWRQAITPTTRMLYLETPANPTLELADLQQLAQLAETHRLLLVVDNVFCTPCLQRPLELGAHLVVHSATKYLDGQGRVLGGAIIGSQKLLMDHVYPFIRNTGPSLSPFNAWVLFKGLETLPVRIEKQCDNAEQVAQFFNQRLSSGQLVHYPGLPRHPQHALAARQMRRFGAIVCVDLGSLAAAHRFIDQLQLATITANLGDVRTLVTHPATTTHGRLSPEMRAAAGVTDGLVRLSIGMEDIQDILADLDQALARVAS